MRIIVSRLRTMAGYCIFFYTPLPRSGPDKVALVLRIHAPSVNDRAQGISSPPLPPTNPLALGLGLHEKGAQGGQTASLKSKLFR